MSSSSSGGSASTRASAARSSPPPENAIAVRSMRAPCPDRATLTAPAGKAKAAAAGLASRPAPAPPLPSARHPPTFPLTRPRGPMSDQPAYQVLARKYRPQSFADLIKFALKEPIIPAGANKGVFLLAPSLPELERRLRGRGQDSDAEIARRMEAALEDASHWRDFDHVLVNDHFADTLAVVRGILAAARTRRERNPWLGDFVADLGGPDPATAD